MSTIQYIGYGQVVTPEGVLAGGTVAVRDGLIVGIYTREEQPSVGASDEWIDAGGGYILPGFIDIHVHGGHGSDVCDPDADAPAKVCRFHAKHGTTGLLLTTRTLPEDEVTAVLERLDHYFGSPDELGAVPLGIHLEGPFIHEKYKGAQSAEHIIPPSADLMERWLAASGGHIRLVTLAPEAEGASDLIPWLAEQSVRVSAGHCGPDYEQMQTAIELGVRHVTHCYNGMRGFSHRDPGMLAAVLMEPRVTTELILDNLHVHPAAGRLLLHAKGAEGVALITDAIRACGMPDGEYTSAGGRKVTVSQGAARLPEGSLAGSTLTMDRAFKHAISLMGATLQQASEMASLTPARTIGMDKRKGSIAPGKDADLVVMDSDFNVQWTMIAGNRIEQN